MKQFHLLIVITALLMTACRETPPEPQPSSEKEFVAFTIDRTLNPGLEKTIIAEITDKEIRLKLPELADRTALIPTFEYKGEQVLVDNDEQESGVTEINLTVPVEYVIRAEDGSEKSYSVVVTLVDKLRSSLPHIYIDIENGDEITSKEDYVSGTVRIDGKGEYDDYEGTMKIRGRGNSSWSYPKKPYKMKLDKKASLFGMQPYKEWILLSEYLDGTMLDNSIPYKAARLLEMPFTNHMLPVELTINGEYRGVYTFTEHKEAGPGRIDVGDNGVLLELDTYFDEAYKFRSPNYNLPVMIAYPKEKEMTGELYEKIRDDFNAFEALVFDGSFPDNGYRDYFDDISFVNYMIVYQLTLNQEINHPKSTYINKPEGGKYRMGIIWDFDWGYGFEQVYTHYRLSTAGEPLFWSKNPGSLGRIFFLRLMSDPHMKQLFVERWEWFRTNKYDELKEYVTTWSGLIAPALEADHELWGARGSSGNAATDLQRVLGWLDARVQYIDSWVADF